MEFLKQAPYFERLAMVESSMNPQARNDSGAAGLFQFMPETAQAYGLDDPFDPQKSFEVAQKFTEDNRNYLRQKLGREPTGGELYLAHQQGMGGATKLLSNPNAPAVDLVGQQAVLQNGGREDMTGADFANQWISKFEGNDEMLAQGVNAESDLVDIELPDGTIVEGVPAGISKSELVAKLQANGMDVSGLADTAPEEDVAAVDAPEKDMNRAEAALRSGVQGLTFGFGDEAVAGLAALGSYPIMSAMGIRDGKSLGDLYGEALQSERDDIERGNEQYPIQSLAAEIGGGVLTGGGIAAGAKAVAPKAMSALSKYAAANPIKSAATTALGTGSLYGYGTGEGDAGDRGINALKTGAISVPFGVGGGYIASKLGSRGASLADDAADEVSDIVGTGFKKSEKQLSKSALARLTPEQQARSTALVEAGIPREKQTAAMITRDPKQWQFEQNTKGVAGVGDEIRNRYVQANELIKGRLNDLGVKTGGKATTAYEAGESVTESVINKSREMQDEIGKMYGQIREEVGDQVGFKPAAIVNALDEASDNAYADNVVNSMTRKMKRYGILDSNGAVVEDATLSVKNAEELRKFANSLRGDKQTEHIVGNVINALDDDVINTAGTDSFKQARDAARNRFKEFETKILKNITDERLASDDVLQRTVFGGKVKDLQALKQSLTSGTPDQTARGAQAWNDLKLQTLQKIIDDSSVANGKVQGSRFNRQLEKIGKERLETVFDPEELLQLKTIQKALEYTTIEVPESVVNYSGTGAANANNALAGILESSGTGRFLKGAADKVSAIPVVGQVASPLSALARMGGQTLEDAATSRSIKNILNPESALRRIADPRAVGAAGISGGISGNRSNDKPE